MRPSVRLRLRGALGNQLWQLSAAYLVAAQRGRSLILDTSMLDSYTSAYWLGSFCLNSLDLPVRRTRRSATLVRAGGPVRRLRRAVLERIHNPSRVPPWFVPLDEDAVGQEYASLRLMTEAPPTRLLGYFQDAALVDAAKARGFPEVLYLEEPSARALDVFREATESSVLGIHIRLRDFPQSSRLSAEQYLDALATSIMKPSERATTWIFTDDPGKIEPFMVRLSQFRPRLAVKSCEVVYEG